MAFTQNEDDGIFPVTFIRPMREVQQVNEYLASTLIENNHIGLQKLRRLCSEIFEENKAKESRIDPNDTIGDLLFPGLRYCGIRPYLVTRHHRHDLRDYGPASWIITTTPATHLKIVTPGTASLKHYGVSLGTMSSEALYERLLGAEKQSATYGLLKNLTVQARAKSDVDWLLFAYVTEIREPAPVQASSYVTVTVHAIENPLVDLILFKRPFNTLHDGSWPFVISLIPPIHGEYFYRLISNHLKKEAEQRADALGLMSLHLTPPTYSSRHASQLEYLLSPSK